MFGYIALPGVTRRPGLPYGNPQVGRQNICNKLRLQARIFLDAAAKAGGKCMGPSSLGFPRFEASRSGYPSPGKMLGLLGISFFIVMNRYMAGWIANEPLGVGRLVNNLDGSHTDKGLVIAEVNRMICTFFVSIAPK